MRIWRRREGRRSVMNSLLFPALMAIPPVRLRDCGGLPTAVFDPARLIWTALECDHAAVSKQIGRGWRARGRGCAGGPPAEGHPCRTRRLGRAVRVVDGHQE